MSARQLAAVPQAVNDELIENLREALALAQSGELTSAVVVGALRGNQVFNAAGFNDGLLLLGCLSHAMHTVSACMRSET